MKEIPLSQGKVALVDDEDFDRLMAMGKWHCNDGYGKITLNYRKPDGTRGAKKIWMHRAVLNAPPGKFVDHISGSRLDNRKANLRFCSHNENQRNSGPQKNNTSGYKGVSWHKRRQKFDAKIVSDRKSIYLGSYESAKLAAIAYNEAALKIHGDFAKLNEIPSND